MALADLFGRACRRGMRGELVADDSRTPIRGVRLDSRLVGPGDLFVAVPGTRADGRAYIDQAVQRGAVAIACAPPALATGHDPRHLRERANVPSGTAAIFADDVAAAAGFLASAFHGDPSDALELVAVTGTNGKTSSTYLLEAVWKAAGRVPGMIGTIVQRCPAFEVTSPMTTPSAVDLQDLLARMRRGGCDSVVMEASSHALDQRRVAGCRFRAGLFTNLTRDHLDYHQTEEAYFAAKASLFRRWLPAGAAAVLNAEDPRVASLAAELSTSAASAPLDVWTYSTDPSARARARVRSAATTLDGIRASLDLDGVIVEIDSPLVGGANLSNLLAVATLARATGVDPAAIEAGLSSCPAVPGRMERMRPASPRTSPSPAVFVDYAHTPDALERSLRALQQQQKEQRTGRIVVVFGCGGDRDRGKRPMMGAIAAELADVAVLTSDNPRSEEPAAIVAEIEAGIGARMPKSSLALLAAPDSRGYLVEVDRLAAIRAAIDIAAPCDVVLIAGKGHEDYQETAGKKRHFDDRELALQMLERGQGGQVGKVDGHVRHGRAEVERAE